MPSDEHLKRIEASGLIQLAQLEPELEYIFRHALIQDAAYAMLVKDQRRAVHAAVAHVLEELYPDRRDELAPKLAYHFDEAGELEKALAYSTLAAEQAASRYANAEAIIHYHRAIELASQLQPDRDTLIKLYAGQGRVYQLSGKHEDALTTYLGLELVARERGDRALELRALMEQSTMYAMLTQQGNPEESIRLSEKALAIAQEIGDEAAESKILWNMSLAKWRSMNIADAIPYAEKSLEIARRLNLREQMAYTLHDLGRYYMLARVQVQAISAQQEAETLWRELGNQPLLADNLSLKANLLYAVSDYSHAQSASEEALKISLAINNRWGQAMSLQSLSQLFQDEGKLTDALEAAYRAISAADEAGFTLGTFSTRGRAIEILEYLGQFERAYEVQAEVVQLASQGNIAWIKGPLALNQATRAARAGDLGLARQILEESRSWPRPSGPSLPSFLDMRRAELALSIQEYEQVISIISSLDLTAFGLQLAVTDASQMARHHGQALMALGRWGEARAEFDFAFSLISDELIHYQRWELFAAMAELDDLEGDTASARARREQARAEIQYLSDNIGDPELQASFRARPDVAQLLASA